MRQPPSVFDPCPSVARFPLSRHPLTFSPIQARLVEMAEVVFTPEARDQAAELPRVIRARVLSLALRLEKWPEVSGVKPLTGDLAGHWRVQTGDYRLQFRVEGETVLIEKVGHRDGFYGD